MISKEKTSNGLCAYCLNNPVNMVDSDGNFSIAICVLIGFTIGAVYSAYEDYRDDYKFNGSIGWKTYKENMLFGSIAGLCIGSIGAVLEYAVPVLNTYCNTTFTIGNSIGASSSVATLTSGITFTGSDILIGTGVAVAAAGINMVLAKGYGPRPGHNQHENKMWRQSMKDFNIRDKDLERRLYDKLDTYKKSIGSYIEKLKDLN